MSSSLGAAVAAGRHDHDPLVHGSDVDNARSAPPADILLLALALGFGALGFAPLGDPDLWWHLRTGELIYETGFTQTDPWSFASTQVWVLHEWATEVAMYLTVSIGGYRGLVVAHALGMFALAAAILVANRRVAGPYVAAAIGLIALIAVLPGSAERPQLLSWILLAVALPALRRSFTRRTAPWWFIPLIWAWANLHGLWASALVIYCALCLGLVLEVGLRAWRTYRPFFIVGALAIAVVTLTPNGPRLLLTPLHVRDYAVFVSEWRPPSVLSPFNGAAFLILALVVLGWARSSRRATATEILFVLAVSFIGLSYVRTIPVMAIGLAPLAAGTLQRLLGDRPVASMHQSRASLVIGASLTSIVLVLAALWLPQVPPIKHGAPWKASAVLDSLPGRAHVLNEYVWGGWLLWTARDTSPSIDGRTEIYSPSYVGRSMSAVQMTQGWQRFVEREEFDAAWLYRGSPLVFGLKTLGWKTIYKNSYSVILVPGP